MGDIKGFLKYTKELPEKEPVSQRIEHYQEFILDFPEDKTQNQAARCMDCGIPFCHNGCPLGNVIPDFNDAVYRGDWKEAYEIMSTTNNFPEFTGRICPAPCESACVLGINQPPVTIEHIEKSIAEEAFNRGFVRPEPPVVRSGMQVAVVGSGPAGLAAAAQLNKAGHAVTVFERNDEVGGLLRYGIPDFKLEKSVVERRIKVMESEGIKFRTNANVGVNIAVEELQNEYDALVLTGGSTIPRDLPIKGRDLEGVEFAMDFLEQNNRRVAGKPIGDKVIHAKDKHVVVIGGGDTGSDCVGTSNRHKAASVTQLELLVKPPEERHESTPWPRWPLMLRTSSSHEEGADRSWAVLTKKFIDDGEGRVKGLEVVDIEWKKNEDTGRNEFVEKEGSQRVLPCDLALLAIGFVHPQHEGVVEQLGLELDSRGNVKTDNYETSVENVFAAGDMRRGQSLVVWAISEGREAARAVDLKLMGHTNLETKGHQHLEF
ncbi:glutamate synthase subunit beta [Membranicola marinus]|uniref:Glutamate synthase subunit beta n=1 Tax=Membranihabitans marinus TaxID=1227546 RepID=A0A953L6I3_9BACT|nr:glutamate synthase subunit beta [Membranihabitans marinus]MBY5957672.1 glutamate synthase subunit beta [Membranihabitans marinus]